MSSNNYKNDGFRKDKCDPIRTQIKDRDDSALLPHRELGRLQFIDIDGLQDEYINPFIEYKSDKPSAIVDYKNPGERIDLYRMNVLVTIANASNVPAYIVTYFKENHAYHVLPMNQIATDFFAPFDEINNKNMCFTERQYAFLLHKMRNFKLKNSDVKHLKSEIPELWKTWKPNIVRDKYNNIP